MGGSGVGAGVSQQAGGAAPLLSLLSTLVSPACRQRAMERGEGWGSSPLTPVRTAAGDALSAHGVCVSHGATFAVSDLDLTPTGPSAGGEGDLESASPHTQAVALPVEEKM